MEKTNIFVANPNKSGQVAQRIVAFCIVCMLLLAIASCESAKETSALDEKEEEVITDSFSEFSLIETSCKWIRYDGDSGYELIIINSDKELRNYIICAEADDFPTIDFSRYTLLLARGFMGNNCTPDYVILQQTSSESYVMSLVFQQNIADVILHWQVAIITDKLSDSDNVKLNVRLNFKEKMEENTVTFTEFSLSECRWLNITEWTDQELCANSNGVVIINSNEKLRQYIECVDGNYPYIDFSKYTLLLVSGVTPNLVNEVTINSFQQLSVNKYKLDVEVLMGDATMPDKWVTALVINKLSIQSEIELDVTIIN